MSLFCRRFLLSVLSLSLIGLSITTGRQGRAAGPETIEAFADGPQQTIVAGFDFSSLDRNANACQDFNRFANGGWMDRNPIPGAYSRWGRFELLDEQNQNVLHTILDGLLVKKTFANSNEQKIADFYGSCMNEKTIEAEGIRSSRSYQTLYRLCRLPGTDRCGHQCVITSWRYCLQSIA